MFNFFKKTVCEHQFEIIENKDIIENISFANMMNDLLFSSSNKQPTYTSTTLTYTFSKEIEKLLKQKNVSKREFLKAIEKRIAVDNANKDNTIKQLKKQINRLKMERKVIGHYICQRCTKCGKIERYLKYFDPIKQRLYNSDCGYKFF